MWHRRRINNPPYRRCRPLPVIAEAAAAVAQFSPLDLSPALWLDAGLSPLFQLSGGTTAAAADGDPVGYWGDLSGNGNHATQAGAGKRLTLKLAIQNSLPVLRGDGVDDTYQIPTLALTDFEAYFVLRQTGPDILMGSNPLLVVNAQLWIGLAADTDKIGSFDNATTATSDTLSPVQGNWSVLCWSRAGSAMSFYQDGTARGSGTCSGVQSFTELFATADAFNFLSGDAAAILLFPTTLSAPNRVLLFNYLRTRWGTP